MKIMKAEYAFNLWLSKQVNKQVRDDFIDGIGYLMSIQVPGILSADCLFICLLGRIYKPGMNQVGSMPDLRLASLPTTGAHFQYSTATK